ncbi:hypothetical protein V8G54_013463 [Vigna mungo]|uniref:Transposase-associated domain-containing protein n=1 Tax=Vigna mungo TaxID=3915 RepID=A0AAQ3NVQ4_VIGMU
MDRKWMFANRLSKEYEDGVKEFCRFAVEHAENPSRIICPCLKCCYSRVMSADELEEHLICNGIDKSYSCWTRHGENRKNHIDKDFHDNTSYTPKETKTTYKLDEVEEIANVIKEDMRDCPQTFDRLTTDAKTPLYNCVKGMRFGVGHKDYFPSKKRHTHHEHDKLIAQMKDLNERMTQMENEIILLRKIRTSNTIEEADIGVNSSQESCTLSSNIFPEPNVSLPIPIVEDGMMTIGQAIGTFVAWPINRIQVVDECPKQSNDNDCGYYVCRYMKEIVTYCEGGTIPTNGVSTEYRRISDCVKEERERSFVRVLEERRMGDGVLFVQHRRKCDVLDSRLRDSDLSVTSLCAGRWMSRPKDFSKGRGDRSEVAMEEIRIALMRKQVHVSDNRS